MPKLSDLPDADGVEQADGVVVTQDNGDDTVTNRLASVDQLTDVIAQVYHTVSDVEAAKPPSSATSLQTRGYRTVGSGGALYAISDGTGSLLGKIQSVDARWWKIAESEGLCPTKFGSWGTGDIAHEADDLAGLNAIAEFYRNAPIDGSGNSAGRRAQIVFTPGRSFHVADSIDWTGLTGINNLIIECNAAQINAHCTGKVAIDMLGSDSFAVRGLLIRGDPDNAPKIGLQHGRNDTAARENNELWGLDFVGAFTRTGLLNHQAELTFYKFCNFRNTDAEPGTLTTGSFCWIMDGWNSEDVASEFITVDIPGWVAAGGKRPISFVEVAWEDCRWSKAKSVGTQVGEGPIGLITNGTGEFAVAKRHTMKRCYGNVFSGPNIAIDGDTIDFDFDCHLETQRPSQNDPLRTIAAIALTNPIRITTVGGHTFQTGDPITFASVGGTVELNGNTYSASRVSSTVFDLYTLADPTISVNGTSGFTPWTSGGTCVLDDTDPWNTGPTHSFMSITDDPVTWSGFRAAENNFHAWVAMFGKFGTDPLIITRGHIAVKSSYHDRTVFAPPSLTLNDPVTDAPVEWTSAPIYYQGEITIGELGSRDTTQLKNFSEVAGLIGMIYTEASPLDVLVPETAGSGGIIYGRPGAGGGEPSVRLFGDALVAARRPNSHNYLTNSAFATASLGAGPFASDGATLDGWILTNGSGATNAITRIAGIRDATYSVEWNRTVVGSATSFFEQQISDLRRFAGYSVAVSFTARAVGLDMGVTLRSNFGTGGSPSSAVNTTNQILTVVDGPIAERYILRFDVLTAAGKIFGSNNDDYLSLRFFRTSTQGTGKIALENIKVEVATRATEYSAADLSDDVEPFPQSVVLAGETRIASAATCDIGSATTSKIAIYGSTGPITSFGTKANRLRKVRVIDAPTINHGSALALPGAGGNLTLAAGDTFEALSDVDGNWRVYNLVRATGLPIIVFTTVAWASRPSASSVSGKIIQVTDIGQGGSLWISDGTNWKPLGPVVLGRSAVKVSHTGDTNEFALATVTVPAGVMGPNGRISVHGIWSFTGSVNSKTMRARIDSISGTQYLNTSTASATNISWNGAQIIANRNSASSQVGQPTGVGTGETGFTTAAAVTSSIDTASATAILLTGQLTSSGETISLELYEVTLLP